MIVGRIANRGTISAQEIKEAYIKAFNVGLCQRRKVCFHLADAKYKEANPEKIKAVLDAAGIYKKKYSVDENGEPLEWYDCDNFTFDALGALNDNEETAPMPKFATWVDTPEGGHSLLSYYFRGRIYTYEPQTNIHSGIPEDWKLILIIG